jgi:hypothetical protein
LHDQDAAVTFGSPVQPALKFFAAAVGVVASVAQIAWLPADLWVRLAVFGAVVVAALVFGAYLIGKRAQAAAPAAAEEGPKERFPEDGRLAQLTDELATLRPRSDEMTEARDDAVRDARSHQEVARRHREVARRRMRQVESLQDATLALRGLASDFGIKRRADWGTFAQRGVLQTLWGYCRAEKNDDAKVALLVREGSKYGMPHAVGIDEVERRAFSWQSDAIDDLWRGEAGWRSHIVVRDALVAVLIIRHVRRPRKDEIKYFSAMGSLVASAWSLLPPTRTFRAVSDFGSLAEVATERPRPGIVVEGTDARIVLPDANPQARREPSEDVFESFTLRYPRDEGNREA